MFLGERANLFGGGQNFFGPATEGADQEAIEERVGMGPWLSRVLRAPNRLAGETLGFPGVAEEPSRHAEMSEGVRPEVEGENRPKALVVPFVVIGERPFQVRTRAGERFIPNYIENRIKFSPYVRNVAVIGVPPVLACAV